MAPLAIDRTFAAVHTLSDGTPVRLRLLGPEDRERLRAGFERLSPESRYRRFLCPTPRLTERMLTYLTDTDGWNHLAIGAERIESDGRAGDGVGVARFVRLTDEPDVAEAAVTVADDVQQRGLGRLLLATLVEAARERGIRTFRGHVLRSNAAMAALLGELGEQVRVRNAEGLLVCDVPLAVPADQPVPAPHLYRLLRAAGRGLDVVLRVMGPRRAQRAVHGKDTCRRT